MAQIGSTYLTLADRLKQTENGEIAATIIELLAETSAILEDANAMECNDGTSHLTTIGTALPTASFRAMYGYVDPSKSTTAQVRDNTAMLEAYSIVDVDLVDKAPNASQFRLNEARAFLEAMNQTIQDKIFYGNTATAPKEFDGLSPRYGVKSTSKTNIGLNIVDAGGTSTDNTSVWFVTWGDLHTSLIYPKGSQAGIKHTDDGIQTETDSSGGKRKVYQDHFKWDVGMSVRDWRSTVRIANIDVSDLAAKNVLLEDYMIDAYYKIKKFMKTGKTVCYANAEVLTGLHKRAKDKASNLTINEIAGQEIVSFLGIPIREAEQILNTEARVV